MARSKAKRSAAAKKAARTRKRNASKKKPGKTKRRRLQKKSGRKAKKFRSKVVRFIKGKLREKIIQDLKEFRISSEQDLRASITFHLRKEMGKDLNPNHSKFRLSTGLRVRRSEEHTSELQSHLNLVCRLLLEKKVYSSGWCWNS